MSKRQILDKKLNNYKLIADKLDGRVKKIVADLQAERNHLKEKLSDAEFKIVELERAKMQLENKNGLLEVKSKAYKRQLDQCENFSKGVLEIAQHLAIDDSDKNSHYGSTQTLQQSISEPIRKVSLSKAESNGIADKPTSTNKPTITAGEIVANALNDVEGDDDLKKSIALDGMVVVLDL